jgi:outer membrane murein-binding lipoprotein Lpp
VNYKMSIAVLRQPVSRDQALARLLAIEGEPYASQLGREWDWSRAKVRRFIAACRDEGIIPPSARATNRSQKRAAKPPQAADAPLADNNALPSTPATPSKRPPRSRAALGENFLMCWLLRLAAVLLGTIALVLNAKYYASLGRSPFESTVLATLGGIIDLLMVTSVSVASKLWDRRRPAAAGVAFATWLFAVLMSSLASNGFTSNNILDTVSSRAKTASESSSLDAKLLQLRHDREAVTESRSAAAIEGLILQQQPRVPAWKWTETKGCTTAAATGPACRQINVLREAKAQAERRDQLDDKIAKAESDFHALPAYASADPGGEMVPKLVNALSLGLVNITAENVQTIRIGGLTLAPLGAGIVLLLATLLGRERPKRNSTTSAGGGNDAQPKIRLVQIGRRAVGL